jgi:GrpB-like predicted nucleotidyltransferase (UPF0157 family)
VDVIVICGPTGVGKTTTAFEMSRKLTASGTTHAVIDTDELDRVFPQPSETSELVALSARNLKALWENFAALGHRRLILCGVMLDGAAAKAWIGTVLGQPKMTVVRLLASDATLSTRICAREIGSGREHHLQIALRQARQLDRPSFPDEVTVITDERTPGEIAEEVLHWSGWDYGRCFTPPDVHIVDYDPTWSTQYAEEAALLGELFGTDLLAIEHVGSTSIPGMASKPVIDMLAEIAGGLPLATMIDQLASASYFYTPVFEDESLRRQVFRKGPTDMTQSRTHHLHVCERAGIYWQRIITFRDYLRAHPDEADRYAALKRDLEVHFGTDPRRYTAAKAEYVRTVVERGGGRWS